MRVLLFIKNKGVLTNKLAAAGSDLQGGSCCLCGGTAHHCAAAAAQQLLASIDCQGLTTRCTYCCGPAAATLSWREPAMQVHPVHLLPHWLCASFACRTPSASATGAVPRLRPLWSCGGPTEATFGMTQSPCAWACEPPLRRRRSCGSSRRRQCWHRRCCKRRRQGRRSSWARRRERQR